MKIARAVLSKHLKRIMCGGQIKEAIFGTTLEVRALTEDQLMLVLAPGLSKTELSEEVGLADLSKLQRALSMVAPEGDEEGSAGEVDLDIEEGKFVLDPGPARGLVVNLIAAAPRTISTRVDAAIVDQLIEKIGDTVIPLTARMLRDIAKTFSGLAAEEVELTVGPKGGSIRVGEENSDTAQLTVPELKAPEPYSLLFGRHLIDALAAVVDEAAVLYLSGPGGSVVLQDGEYQYFLSPLHRSADRNVKKAPAAEAAPAKVKKSKSKTVTV